MNKTKKGNSVDLKSISTINMFGFLLMFYVWMYLFYINIFISDPDQD